MKRREFVLKIGKENYTFSERNRDDSAYFDSQERIRQKKFQFIQENVKEPDDRLALMMSEMNKIYTAAEVGIFIFSSKDEQYRIAYDSFKIKNDVSFEEFKKLLPESELENTVEMIHVLESEDDGNVKKKKVRS